MSEQGEQLRAPQYLDQVEHLIGISFFSDTAQGEIARANPNLLDPEIVQPRIPVYVAGLRLLSRERTQSTPLPARNREIGAVRGRLMTIDPDLQTDEVRALRSALSNYREENPPAPFEMHPSGRQADMLVPWLLPAQSVNSIVSMSSGGVLHALRHRGIVPPKLKLPGSAPREVCCDWDLVRELVDLHGMRPELEGQIDLGKLPRGPEDTSPERLAYARELQLRFVAADKLRNIPELIDRLPPPVRHGVAQPYHISRGALARLLGGGFHFIADYCKDTKLDFLELRRPGGRGAGIGKYMLLEEAAEIWKLYKSVPEATIDDVTIISAATEIGVSKTHFRSELTADEERAVRDMRALQPAGRVLPHLRAELAAQAKERLRRRPLPPHLLHAQVLDKYFAITYSGIMRASYAHAIPTTPVRLIGSDKRQSCFTWQGIRRLEEDGHIALRPGGVVISYSRLPADENDLDPERIAYAREIQALYVNLPEQVDQTPIEEWIAQRREQLGLTAEVAAAVAVSAAVEAPAAPAEESAPATAQTPEAWAPLASGRGSEALRGHRMDVAAIASHTGTSVEHVRTVIASTDFRGCNPPERSKTARVSLLYSGRALERIVDGIVGIHETVLAGRTGFTQYGIQRLLSERGFSVTRGQRYSPTMQETLLRLRRPQGARPFEEAAAQVGWDIPKAKAFIDRHYGRIETFLDPNGEPIAHLDAGSYDLLLHQRPSQHGQNAQQNEYQRAQPGWRHPRQFVPESGLPYDEFNRWLGSHLTTTRDIQWMIAHDESSAVLRHYRGNLIDRYLAYAKLVRQRRPGKR